MAQIPRKPTFPQHVVQKMISRIEQYVDDDVIPVSTGIYTQQKLMNQLQAIPKPVLIDYDDRIFYELTQKQGTCPIQACPLCSHQFSNKIKPVMCHFCTKWCCEECLCHRKRLHPLQKNPNGTRYNICYDCDAKYLNLVLNHPYVQNRTLLETAIVEVSKLLEDQQQKLDNFRRKIDAIKGQPKRKLNMKQSILKKQQLDAKKHLKKVNWDLETEKDKKAKLNQKLCNTKMKYQKFIENKKQNDRRKQKQKIQQQRKKQQQQAQKVKLANQQQQRRILQQQQKMRKQKQQKQRQQKMRIEKQKQLQKIKQLQIEKQKQKQKKKIKQKQLQIQKQKQKARQRQIQRQQQEEKLNQLQKQKQKQKQIQREKQIQRKKQEQRQRQIQKQKQEQRKRQQQIKQKERQYLIEQQKLQKLLKEQNERKDEQDQQNEEDDTNGMDLKISNNNNSRQIMRQSNKLKPKLNNNSHNTNNTKKHQLHDSHNNQIQFTFDPSKHESARQKLVEQSQHEKSQNTTFSSSPPPSSYLYNQFKNYFTQDIILNHKQPEESELTMNHLMKNSSKESSAEQKQMISKFRRSLQQQEQKMTNSQELQDSKLSILREAAHKQNQWQSMDNQQEHQVQVTGQKCKCSIF